MPVTISKSVEKRGEVFAVKGWSLANANKMIDGNVVSWHTVTYGNGGGCAMNNYSFNIPDVAIIQGFTVTIFASINCTSTSGSDANAYKSVRFYIYNGTLSASDVTGGKLPTALYTKNPLLSSKSEFSSAFKPYTVHYDKSTLNSKFSSNETNIRNFLNNNIQFRYMDSGLYNSYTARTAEIYITVDYTAPGFTVTTTASEGGTVTGGGDYVTGETATLEAVPDNGYVFDKWSDGNTNVTRSFAVTADVTYTATFKPDGINNIYTGAAKIRDSYVGTQRTKAIYVGATKIYG